MALGTLWLGGVGGGLALLAGYDNRPGTAATAPERWPAASRIVLAADRPTLVMLAHPRCVCTRASLGELAELMARAHHRPKAYVVFLKPGAASLTGNAADWEQTDLYEIANRIPDVTTIRDDEGLEAQRFGAATSGQTLLYDARGRLLFSGGTTGSRGHPGDNAGRASILALLNRDATPHHTTTPVFGCPLFGPADSRSGVDAALDHGDHPSHGAQDDTHPRSRTH
jgi:hypothetical protein